MLKLSKYILMTGVAMTMASPVFAQNVNSLESRLNRIEREMNTLSRSVYKGDVPPPTMQVTSPQGGAQTAAMEMRLSQLEDQIRRLTGMIEETSYRVRKLEQAKSAIPTNAVQPQSSLGASNSNAGIQTSPLTVENTPYQLGTIQQNGDVGMSPAGMYDKAFGYLQVNDYASAQATFDNFLATYPDHSLAANAKYWLGETYYARKDYAGASQAFAKSFKDHPDGQKAPDTLLRLAMSLKGQDMTTEACLTLSELDKRFPNAPSSVASKASEARTEYACE